MGSHWPTAIGWGGVALVVASLFSLAIAPTFSPSSDVWDYAQEARQIYRGEGFTSLYTYPVHLGDEDPPFAVRWRMPLYALIGAILLVIGVPLPWGFLLVGVIAHGVIVTLTYKLAAVLHSAQAGAIAAAVALFSPLLLDSYNPGMSQAPAAALAVIVWLLALRGRGVASAIGAAMTAAAAWYLRGESLLFVPIWVAVLASPGEYPASRRWRWERIAVFIVVYAAACVPYVLHLVGASGDAAPIRGNPALLYTSDYPGYSSSRTYAEPLPGILEYVLAHPVAFAVRFAKDVVGFGIDLLGGVGPVAVGLALAGLLFRDTSVRWPSLRPLMPFVVASVIHIAAFSCLERSSRFLVPIVPLACIVIGFAAAPSLGRICGWRMVQAFFVVLLLERAATVAFQTRDAPRRHAPIPSVVAEELREQSATWPRDGLVLSDAPDWIAWHLDRTALLLPLHRQLENVAQDHPVSAIVLSPSARARNVSDGERAWVRVIDRRAALPGYRGPEVLGEGVLVYAREIELHMKEL